MDKKQIFSLISSEYLLSLYPSVIHFVPLPLEIQMWGRFLIFAILGFIFGSSHVKNISMFLDWKIILLSIINVIHIFSSYYGFRYMKPADAYAIFYQYPFINLILLFLNGEVNLSIFQWMFFSLSVLGIILLRANKFNVLIMYISAITESLLYFMIRIINPVSSWDGVYFSYVLPAIIMTLIFYTHWRDLEIPALMNGFVGSSGYSLRFWNAVNVKPEIFSLFSFIGIPFSYINQYFINNIVPDVLGATGAFIILTSLIMSVIIHS